MEIGSSYQLPVFVGGLFIISQSDEADKTTAATLILELM